MNLQCQSVIESTFGYSNPGDRMVPVTVAEQSHRGEARELDKQGGGRREGGLRGTEKMRAQMEVTLQSGSTKTSM